MAAETEVFFFSDGAKQGDEEQVGRVRKYLRSVAGFEKVTIVERTNNDRVANNRGGMEELLERFGRIIWLEEDVVTAPGFLAFMNGALDAYKEDQRILGITGYVPPIRIPRTYGGDAFVLPRFCAWGFATWSGRFRPWEIARAEVDLSESVEKNLCDVGIDSWELLKKVATNELDALDVMATYYQARTGMHTIYPVQSFVQNVGHDGSGLHCGVNRRFYHKALNRKTEGFEFKARLELDRRILKRHRRFRDRGVIGSIERMARRTGTYGLLVLLRDKLPKLSRA